MVSTKKPRKPGAKGKPAHSLMRESEIRDKLASRLNVLEPGLTLIAKEFELPAFDGIERYLDILARDQFGCLVIIEVKNSEKAARQGVQQFLTYEPSLRHQYGLEEHEIRFILASTEWREVHRAFSELAREARYDLRGYKLILDANGELLPAEKFSPLPPVVAPEPWPEQTLLFFTSAEARDHARSLVASLLGSEGFEHFILSSLDRRIANGSKHNAGLHIAVACLREPATEEEQEARSQEFRADEARDLSSPARSIEELRMSNVIRQLRLQKAYDDLECCNERKLAGALTIWNLVATEKSGQYPMPPKASNEEAALRLTGVSKGTSPYDYRIVLSPEHRSAWNRGLHDLRQVLAASPTWLGAANAFLDRFSELVAAEVHVGVHMTRNLLQDLVRAVSDGSPEHLPWIKLHVSVAGTVVHCLEGALIWDRCTFPANPERIIRSICADKIKPETIWFRAAECTSAILHAHGLSFCAFIGSRQASEEEFEIQRLRVQGKTVVGERASHEISSLGDFFEINAPYLRELVAYVQSKVFYIGQVPNKAP